MRWIFSVVFGVFVAAAALAPVLAADNRVEATVFYAAFRPFCHQQLERVWWLAGEPLAVCVRCLGVYLGVVAAVFAAAQVGSRRAILGAGMVCLASWVLEVTGVFAFPVEWRFVTGLALGLTVGRAVASGLSATGRARTETCTG